MKQSKGEIAFTWASNVFMLVFSFLVVYPFWNILVISLNEGRDAMRGGIYLWPREFSLAAYELVFQRTGIIHAAWISFARTMAGIGTGLFATALLAFILAKRDLLWRRFFIFVFIIPMYFSGGIVPTYILIRQLGLINSFLVYIVPPLIGLWNLMILRTFFEELPSSLMDSARIDGCSEGGIFVRIALPLSMPALACIALFIGVGQWNAWFDTYVYTSDQRLLTLQGVLVNVLWEKQASAIAGEVDTEELVERAQTATQETVQMAIIMITTLPIVMIYPFLQRYFVKGVMIGAIKG